MKLLVKAKDKEVRTHSIAGSLTNDSGCVKEHKPDNWEVDGGHVKSLILAIDEKEGIAFKIASSVGEKIVVNKI